MRDSRFGMDSLIGTSMFTRIGEPEHTGPLRQPGKVILNSPGTQDWLSALETDVIPVSAIMKDSSPQSETL